MVRVKMLEALLKLVLASAYLKNERPLSALIVAPPESGKTELLLKAQGLRGVVLLTDATAFGITKTFLPQIETGHLKHILIPDLITPFSKKQSTVQSLVSFLNNLVEEGIIEIATFGVNLKKDGIRCGLIAAITPNELKDRRHRWGRLGFMSRLLPISFTYSKEAVSEIMESILERKYLHEPRLNLELPDKEVEVKLPKKYAQAVLPLTKKLANAGRTYGFRYQRHFQVLLEASALLHSRDEVSAEDVELIKKLAHYVNLEMNQI